MEDRATTNTTALSTSASVSQQIEEKDYRSENLEEIVFEQSGVHNLTEVKPYITLKGKQRYLVNKEGYRAY